MSELEHAELDASALALCRIARVLDERIDAPRHAAGRERLIAQATRRWRSTSPLRSLLLAAALTLPLALFVFLRQPARLEYRVTGPVVRDGAWLGVAAAGAPLGVHFSDGTELGLAPGSKGRVAELTSDGARVVLGAGHLQARVVHRKLTHWVVAAGPYEIEVTGTAFDVDWSDANSRLDLILHDGSVIVRGPSLPDGLRVSAGQRLVARANTGEAELASALATPADAALPKAASAAASSNATKPSAGDASEPEPSSNASGPSSATSALAHPQPTWSEMLADGNFRGVRDAAEARGVDGVLSRGSLSDLVALADAARYLHERGLAERGLLAERARFAGSAEARAAAFVLGRMADDAGSRADAIRWYDTYLGESPRGAFIAEALGRKLVALVESGQTARAEAAAAEYLRRFPRGPHAAYARDHAGT
ncbi:MAG TPA: FecR domain-containing protein [Polyangiaceae bacterium]|nr:FecR domain-containing protein [Polyangiaceae bacterium]